MTNYINDPQITLIRKLLKKAEGAARLGTPAGDIEANLFNEHAAVLIAKHGVDQALLAEKGEIQDAIISKMIPILGTYAMDRRVLLGHIILAFGAKAVIIPNHRVGTYQGKTYTIHVFAYESDMNRIEFLFEMLQPQMLLGAAAAYVPYYDNVRAFRKSWMSGFAAAVYNRLKRNETKAAADAGVGTDLVLFNRSAAVERAHDEAYPKLGAPTTRKLAGSGRSQGYAAGTRASLGDNELVGNRAAAIAG